MSGLVASWLVGAGLVTLALAGLTAWRRWSATHDRYLAALRDPGVDLGVPALDDPVRARVDGVSTADPVERVRAVLALAGTWRGALARLPLEGVPEGLRAEVRARLGHLDEALAAVAGLAADDASACAVRALGYEAAGDVVRAESARVAAVWCASDADKERFVRELAEHRARWPRRRTEPERLWDP